MLEQTEKQNTRKKGLDYKPEGVAQGLEASVEDVKATEGEPDPAAHLMERCVERENVLKAWARVRANKGAAGIDGMSVEEAGKHLRKHWKGIRAKLLKGSWQPQPVKRVEIPKSGGGMRQLGIPTVCDRLIQQCILQVLQPLLDPTFHPHSYGFRPGKSAHQAILRATELVKEGKSWVADVDLEKFFDRVNHDILLDRVIKRGVKDKRLIRLIGRYLRAGVMINGVSVEREEGTPQGGPLSPLLANLMLDEVDWQLEKRGLAFCRYADDCNIYVGSRRAAERALQTMQKLTGKLKLKINESKSAVGRAWERKFLGYSFWRRRGEIKRRVAPQAIKKFKLRVKQLTRRTKGVSVEDMVGDLSVYLRGWRNYFWLAETPRKFSDMDGWIRRRLRAVYLKHWKRGKTCYQELVKRGASPSSAKSAAGILSCYWRLSGSPALNVALPKAHFAQLGLYSLA